VTQTCDLLEDVPNSWSDHFLGKDKWLDRLSRYHSCVSNLHCSGHHIFAFNNLRSGSLLGFRNVRTSGSFGTGTSSSLSSRVVLSRCECSLRNDSPFLFASGLHCLFCLFSVVLPE